MKSVFHWIFMEHHLHQHIEDGLVVGGTPRSAGRGVSRSSRARAGRGKVCAALLQPEYKDVPDLSDIFVATTH